MTRLEVQYAVRIPGPDGWVVMADRYGRRDHAERVAGVRGPGAEVVAHVVMVAGDWTDPDTAEGVVRDHEDRERAHETMTPGPEVYVSAALAQQEAWRPDEGDPEWQQRIAERMAAEPPFRVVVEAAYQAGIEQARREVPDGIVSFEGEVSAEEVAEFKARWREVHGGGRGRAHATEPIELEMETPVGPLTLPPESAIPRWDDDPPPQPFVLRRRTPEERRAYLDAKRAELEAAGEDTAIIDLIEQIGDEHG